jgi:hypothetical protein
MWVHGLAAGDRGSIYLFGNTKSSLGRENMGKLDAFFAKYDQTGTQVWVRQVGTPQDDGCNGLDIDADGNLYITGHTQGDFAKPNKGGQDMFIAAYTQAGVLLWKDQIGTGANVGAAGIGLDDNKNVYVCGGTSGNLARANNGKRLRLRRHVWQPGQSEQRSGRYCGGKIHAHGQTSLATPVWHPGT